MERKERTYQWRSVRPMQEAMENTSGLERLQEAIRIGGQVPPMSKTIDFTLTDVGEGTSAFVGTPQEFHYNPIGTVHGGYFAILLDSAMGCAVNTTLAAGEGHTTLEYKVNLVRGLNVKTGPIRAEGWVVHRGRRMATAEGRLVGEDGKIYAHGSTTCMIFPTKSSGDKPNQDLIISDDDAVHERTYNYSFGEKSHEMDLSVPGLEQFQNRLEEKSFRPPIGDTMGMDLATVEKGRITFASTPAEYHYNPMGSVHGGYAGTLLDSAMGCAVHTTMPAGVGYTTLEFKVNLVRPMTKDTGPIKAEGWLVHGGRSMATAEGRITDANGKLYAHASTTCMVFAPR
ncbi:MAG: PaaI family thioesterase [Rhodospirillales bacterium]|nr:PaaI family thioesterase [Rhodospirillales bacterium]